VSLDQPRYQHLHRSFLTSTTLKIDVELFKSEIKSFSDYFFQWGKHHAELPRYGAALVNQDGILHNNSDPINGSLYEWNSLNPDHSIIESDCQMPTEIMNLPSLSSLDIFRDCWYRSNILKWNKGARFLPHIDNLLPAPWIRLWGTTSSNISLRYWNNVEMIEVKNIVPGQIYIIDTSLVHDAESFEDDVYQFFLCVSTGAYDLLERLV
jgi:hypothetical protein